MTIQRIVMPIFESSIHMITTQDEARAFLEQHSESPDGLPEWVNLLGFSQEITDAKGMVRHVLCVFDGTVNTAIHESVHTAQRKMLHLNLKQKPSEDETLACFTAWISDQMIELINEQRVIQ